MASTSTVCVVLDGANVATRKDGQRAIPRLAAALTFFSDLQRSRQCALRCVAFVPNFWLNSKPADASKGNGSMETDDWDLLKSLVDQELVVLTPSHAHDDYYVIDYAVKNDGFVVTNDMFRDHVEQKRVFQGRKLTQRWVRSRCIDFTFVGNEFLPNSQTIERAISHTPRPDSPRDTVPATATATASATAPASAPLEASATATEAAVERPKTPRTPRRKAPLRSSSLVASTTRKSDEDDDEEDDATRAANAMAVDQVRKRNVDLSELTPYRVPRHLLPLLHGDDGQTMGRFMDHTATYIVLPAQTANASLATSNVATLSIYGPEPNRMQAVKILDAALPELQQQYEFQLQQQQWLQNQQLQQAQFAHQQQQQQFQNQSPEFQQQQLLLHQQQLYHQQQQYYQQHHQQHLHLPAEYPQRAHDQHHHHHYAGDDHMDVEL